MGGCGCVAACVPRPVSLSCRCLGHSGCEHSQSGVFQPCLPRRWECRLGRLQQRMGGPEQKRVTRLSRCIEVPPLRGAASIAMTSRRHGGRFVAGLLGRKFGTRLSCRWGGRLDGTVSRRHLPIQPIFKTCWLVLCQHPRHSRVTGIANTAGTEHNAVLWGAVRELSSSQPQCTVYTR